MAPNFDRKNKMTEFQDFSRRTLHTQKQGFKPSKTHRSHSGRAAFQKK